MLGDRVAEDGAVAEPGPVAGAQLAPASAIDVLAAGRRDRCSARTADGRSGDELVIVASAHHDLALLLELADRPDDVLLGLLDLAQADRAEQLDLLEEVRRRRARTGCVVILSRTASATPLSASASSPVSTSRRTSWTERSSRVTMSSNMNIRLLTSSASDGSSASRPSTI